MRSSPYSNTRTSEGSSRAIPSGCHMRSKSSSATTARSSGRSTAGLPPMSSSGGQTIRRGEGVIVILGSANRDPSRFTDPDTLDLARADVKHLAFGRGSHYCLGAPLARVEAEVALTTLLRRLPGLRLAIPVEELNWRPVPLFRSLASLPVAW